MTLAQPARRTTATPATPTTGSPAHAPGRVGNIVGVAYGLVALSSSAAAVVVPTIRSEFDLSLATGAWVITAFVISLAASAPVYGRIADHIGPRTPITVGLLILSIGALLSAAAPTASTLIAARALLGLGAGAMPVLAPVIIAGNTTPEDRPQVLTRMSGIVAASASGLLIGAVLAEFFGWRPALALPALGLVLLGPIRGLTSESSGTLRGIDVLGALGVVSIAVGLNLSLQLGSNVTAGGIGVAMVIVGIAASITGGRRSQPFIPRSVLRRSATWRIAVPASAIPAIFFSLLIVIPNVLSEQHGLGRITIGALLFPAALTGIFVGPLAIRLRRYLSTPQEAAAGLTISLVAVLGSSLLMSSPIGLAVSFSLLAVAFGLGQGALLALLTSVTPPDEQGAALAVFTVIFFMGGGIGGTLLTIVGQHLSLATSLALMAALPAAAALAILRGSVSPTATSS